MNVSRRTFLLAALLPAKTYAQGFAGLGSDADGFRLPQRSKGFDFPADHGPHPGFRIEWWYVTANMSGPDGTPYGLQWTLFRAALSPDEAEGWADPVVWMAHAALTTADQHHVAEKLARAGIGQAGVTAQPFEAWIDDWRTAGPSLSDVDIVVNTADFGYDIHLSTAKPFVPQGDNGYSVKSPAGQASRYYSQPFYDLSGTITLTSGSVPVTGHAWLDREWSSQPLTATQTGWDWFSLAFDTGERFMGYRLRDRDGSTFDVATWIAADGTPTPYDNGAFSAKPLAWHAVAGRTLPVRWQVSLPAKELSVTVDALNPDAWMTTRFPYWEGPVNINGSHRGRGYLEMTGYEG